MTSGGGSAQGAPRPTPRADGSGAVGTECDNAKLELRRACRVAGIGVVAVSSHDGRPRVHRAVPALSARLVVSPGAPIEVRYDGQARQVQAAVAGLMRPGVATPANHPAAAAAGAEVNLRAADDRGVVNHAELALGSVTFAPAQSVEEWGWSDPGSLGGSPVLITLTAPDPDATADRKVRHGAELVIPVGNRPYGRRQGR